MNLVLCTCCGVACAVVWCGFGRDVAVDVVWRWVR